MITSLECGAVDSLCRIGFVLVGILQYVHIINVILKQKLLLPAKPTKCTGFCARASCCAVWWLYCLCIHQSQQHVCGCRDTWSSLTADDLSSCHWEVAHVLWGNLKKAKRCHSGTVDLVTKKKNNNKNISERLQDQQTICLLVCLFQKIDHLILQKHRQRWSMFSY